MGKFGWSLPPGCGALPGEEPDPCEDCWNYNEDTETCPAGDLNNMQDTEKFNFLMCPVHSMVDKCANCEKKMRALMGYLPKKFITCNPWEGDVGCCSEKCAQELKVKFEKEVKLERENEDHLAQMTEDAMKAYEGEGGDKINDDVNLKEVTHWYWKLKSHFSKYKYVQIEYSSEESSKLGMNGMKMDGWNIRRLERPYYRCGTEGKEGWYPVRITYKRLKRNKSE